MPSPSLYLSVLVAVILALGLARILMGASVLMQHHQRIRPYFLHSLWVAFLLLAIILLWWVLWGLREIVAWNFFSYLYLLTGPILLFLAISILVPNSVLSPDQSADAMTVADYYFQIHRLFFLILAALLFWVILLRPVFIGSFSLTVVFQSIMLALSLVLAFTSNRKIHTVLSFMFWILIICVIFLFRLKLGGI